MNEYCDVCCKKFHWRKTNQEFFTICGKFICEECRLDDDYGKIRCSDCALEESKNNDEKECISEIIANIYL